MEDDYDLDLSDFSSTSDDEKASTGAGDGIKKEKMVPRSPTSAAAASIGLLVSPKSQSNAQANGSDEPFVASPKIDLPPITKVDAYDPVDQNAAPLFSLEESPADELERMLKSSMIGVETANKMLDIIRGGVADKDVLLRAIRALGDGARVSVMSLDAVRVARAVIPALHDLIDSVPAQSAGCSIMRTISFTDKNKRAVETEGVLDFSWTFLDIPYTAKIPRSLLTA